MADVKRDASGTLGPPPDPQIVPPDYWFRDERGVLVSLSVCGGKPGFDIHKTSLHNIGSAYFNQNISIRIFQSEYSNMQRMIQYLQIRNLNLAF